MWADVADVEVNFNTEEVDGIVGEVRVCRVEAGKTAAGVVVVVD